MEFMLPACGKEKVLQNPIVSRSQKRSSEWSCRRIGVTGFISGVGSFAVMWSLDWMAGKAATALLEWFYAFNDIILLMLLVVPVITMGTVWYRRMSRFRTALAFGASYSAGWIIALSADFLASVGSAVADISLPVLLQHFGLYAAYALIPVLAVTMLVWATNYFIRGRMLPSSMGNPDVMKEPKT